ncbi:MAG TPA: polyphosphate polymerase domain-containing protein [Oscillospiraceae bacterium]|nr:polyphosphate polymerase domain-containing protein [Oscillospiraceae bacterium]
MFVRRTENKYLLTTVQAAKIIGELSAVLPQDPHGACGNGYLIRSLYYDTPDNRCCTEKEDGIYCRDKIRLRVYPPEFGFAKMEIKHRDGDARSKCSLPMTRAQAEAMQTEDYRPLLELPQPEAAQLYCRMTEEMWRPKAVIQYRRLAFAVPLCRTRITFDSDIRMEESGRNLFSAAPKLCPATEADVWVMEVKFSGWLPDYIQDLLTDRLGAQESCSKYGISRLPNRITVY